MKPWELLGEARMNDDTLLVLQKRDTEYALFAGGKLLMSSRQHGSEEALASLACANARSKESPSVLVGGLGMGFTLRATLDLLPQRALVYLAELQPAVIDWNRGVLGHWRIIRCATRAFMSTQATSQEFLPMQRTGLTP